MHPRRSDLIVIRGLVDLGMRGQDCCVAGAQLGARGLKSDPRPEPREDLGHAVLTTGDHGGRQMVGAGDDVGDDLRLHGVGHGWLYDSHDRRHARATVALEAHLLSDDAWVRVQRRAPESIGQHDCAGGIGTVVGGTEQAAEHRAQSHHLEVVAVDDSGGNLARRAEPHDGEVDRRNCAQIGDRLQPRTEVVDFGDGEGRVVDVDAGSALPQVDEAVFVSVGERTQQHGAHDAEDGGVGADAESERDGDGDPEWAHAPQ